MTLARRIIDTARPEICLRLQARWQNLCGLRGSYSSANAGIDAKSPQAPARPGRSILQVRLWAVWVTSRLQPELTMHFHAGEKSASRLHTNFDFGVTERVGIYPLVTASFKPHVVKLTSIIWWKSGTTSALIFLSPRDPSRVALSARGNLPLAPIRTSGVQLHLLCATLIQGTSRSFISIFLVCVVGLGAD